MKKGNGKQNHGKNTELSKDVIVSMIKDGNQITNDMHDSLYMDDINKLLDTIIPKSIIEQAERLEKESKKPELGLKRQLIKLIYGKIDKTTKETTTSIREKVISKVAGIVGHIWAAKYFKDEGYNVENEIDIIDKNGERLTASDIVLTAKDGTKKYVEIKTIKALISNEEDYPYGTLIEGQQIPRELYTDIKRSSLEHVAVETAEKAQKQLKRTNKFLEEIGDKNASASLCIYDGVTISDDVKQSIEREGDIIILPLNIDKIFEYSSLLVDTILYKGRNILNPPKGEQERDIHIPDLDI